MRTLRSAIAAAVFLAVAGLPAMLPAADDDAVDRDAIRARNDNSAPPSSHSACR